MTDKIYCAGMYRSGTTLIYNFLKFCGCTRIVKVHDCSFMDSEINAIYCYRDVRDIIASFCIKEQCTFDNFHVRNLKGVGPIELAERMVMMDRKVMDHAGHGRDDLITMRYELDIVSPHWGLLVPIVSAFVGAKIDYEEAMGRFNLSTIKQHTDSLAKWDPHTHWHPRHVHDGKPGKYKMFTAEQIDQFNQSELIRSWLEDNGYE
jgi:hypothetical protein